MTDKTVVAIRIYGNVEMFEFPTMNNALDFITYIEERYVYVDYLIGKHDKEFVKKIVEFNE